MCFIVVDDDVWLIGSFLFVGFIVVKKTYISGRRGKQNFYKSTSEVNKTLCAIY